MGSSTVFPVGSFQDLLFLLPEPGCGTLVPGQGDPGETTDFYGASDLTPILVQDGEPLVAERPGVSEGDGGFTVLLEGGEALGVFPEPEGGLREAGVGELPLLDGFGDSHGDFTEPRREVAVFEGDPHPDEGDELCWRTLRRPGIPEVLQQGVRVFGEVEVRASGDGSAVVGFEGGQAGREVAPGLRVSRFGQALSFFVVHPGRPHNLRVGSPGSSLDSHVVSRNGIETAAGRFPRFSRVLRRGDWVYLLSLLAPVVIYNIALKVVRITGQVTPPGFFGFVDQVRSDVLSNVGFALLWVGLFAVLRSKAVRAVMLVFFHLSCLLPLILNTGSHFYYATTGSTLDYGLIIRTFQAFGEISGVIANEATVVRMLLISVVLFYGIFGPAVVARLVFRRWHMPIFDPGGLGAWPFRPRRA